MSNFIQIWLTQNVVKFLRHIWPIGPFQWKTLFDSSSSTMSFTNLHENRTREKFTTFCVECQNVPKCDINAKCCKFLKTYFALFVLSNERYYYKKDSSSFVIYKPNHENRSYSALQFPKTHLSWHHFHWQIFMKWSQFRFNKCQNVTKVCQTTKKEHIKSLQHFALICQMFIQIW